MNEYVVVYGHSVNKSPTYFPIIYKQKPEHLKGMINLPGGKIEPGEGIVEAAVRELKEETGLEELQEYDNSVFWPSVYLGKVIGQKSIIHCVEIPIVYQEELNPGVNEIEKAAWCCYTDFFLYPNLMPNLRIIIPLMQRGVSGWTIEDLDGDWRDKRYHNVTLTFDTDRDNPLRVSVKSVKYFEYEE